MTRTQFMIQQGATCRNSMWSWSYVNEARRLVIFGAWDVNTKGKLEMILSDEWQMSAKGRRNPGYSEALENIRLVRDEKYRLLTFPMQQDERPDGTVLIKYITPKLTEKKLVKIGNCWFADDLDSPTSLPLPEEITEPEKFREGAKVQVTINAYERNPKARAACISHHGCICSVCGFDFAKFYGPMGEGYIHVHHLTSVGKAGKEYEIDPIKDLIPVCPNCHAMLHRAEPILTVEQLRTQIRSLSSG